MLILSTGNMLADADNHTIMTTYRLIPRESISLIQANYLSKKYDS